MGADQAESGWETALQPAFRPWGGEIRKSAQFDVGRGSGRSGSESGGEERTEVRKACSVSLVRKEHSSKADLRGEECATSFERPVCPWTARSGLWRPYLTPRVGVTRNSQRLATTRFRPRSFQNVDLAEEDTEVLVPCEALKHGIRPDCPHDRLMRGSSPIEPL
jgi:hypothetical protein